MTIDFLLFGCPIPSLLSGIIRGSAYSTWRYDHLKVLDQAPGTIGHIGRSLVQPYQGLLISFVYALAYISYGQKILYFPMTDGLHNCPGHNITGEIVNDSEKVMS